MNHKSKSGCGTPIIEGDNSIQNLIKKIGKGPKLARDLNQEEAKAAMNQILTGAAEPQQTGAFLIAERIKTESAEETAGFVEALRENTHQIHVDVPKLLDLSSAHDGKNRTLVLTPFVAMIMAAAGVPTLVTGGRDIPTKKGICAPLIFQELGITTHNTAEEVRGLLETVGFAYWDVHNYCPKLEALKDLRTSLGLRTGLNTVEKIINPANANYLCTGVFHGPYLKDVSEACQILNYKNLLCAQATEPSTDLPINKRTFYRVLKNGELSDQLELKPEDYDMKQESHPEFREVTAKANVYAVRNALKEQSGLVYEALVYNAGIQLWFTETTKTIMDGIKLAKSIIKSEKIFDNL